MTNRTTLDRESALLWRVARANRAWRLGRITGGTFDRILNRVQAAMEAVKAAKAAEWEAACAARAAERARIDAERAADMRDLAATRGEPQYRRDITH